MIEVRCAGPDDGDVLGEIHAASWEAAYAPFFAPDFAARGVRSRRTRWHARITEGTGTILLAALDGRPLALSVSLPSPTRPGLAEIPTFYGHPDGWGSGIATVLMTETLCRLHDDGFTRVHLWTLRDTPRSRRFYTRSGFTESGAERTYDFGDGNALDQVEYERAC
ncbi:GNAT family N-acetyltransferase [Streptomyces angustmyceticus]|uniref:GNAT family N-acetyltransferase n=1 Tax=Streptomyces angustmyceticus TaxID=285578 RepID=UPI0021AE3A85|nr:GNAT family N-acetyltransferase [Streptomyces angustmyceticus]